MPCSCLPERNNHSVPWETMVGVEQGELGRILSAFFLSLDVTWPRDATLLVLCADWKKDAASLKIEA